MRRFSSALLLTALVGPALAAQEAAAPTGPLTLTQAIELGRRRAIGAVISRLNTRVADERRNQRRADLLPQVNATARYSRQTLNLDEFGIQFATGRTDPFDLYNLRLRASQTLFDASAFARLRAASDSAAAAGLDAQAAGELAGMVSGLAYLRVLGTEETVRARQADSTIAATLLDQAHQLVAAGVSPAIDETRSQVNLAAVATQLTVARNQHERARLDLARALDLPQGERLVLVDSLTISALDVPASEPEAVRFALEHRPELGAERERTRAIRRSLRAIGYENLPSLSLTGEYGGSGRQVRDLNDTYLVALTLSVPILDGFKRQNRHQEQEARLEAQQVREHDLAAQVENDARGALLDLGSAREAAVLAEERVRLAEQELAQADERFQAGVAGSVETTNAQSSLLQARDALIQSRLAYGTARIGLYRALGVLDQLH